ncbi:hypothetical protein ARMSODRAFT_981007 [Armillaria solidipes]|uniref:Uncharacterized protein n=1 Tax=Armillaria solidipes TaxID=1076256 RepID=A0A2H3BG42_9AGAR|nr:hypothetical protein ARMSODRAFT_981007 [Armillaria solidipes]
MNMQRYKRRRTHPNPRETKMNASTHHANAEFSWPRFKLLTMHQLLQSLALGVRAKNINLRTDISKQSVFYPNHSGVTIFSSIDQICLWDLGFDSILSISPTIPNASQADTNFTSLDCLHVPSISIWIDVFMYGTHALKLPIEKLQAIPTKPSLQNLQIILAFRLSSLLQYVLERPSSDWLWQSLAEHAHNVGSSEITIINALPYSGRSLEEWDILVS